MSDFIPAPFEKGKPNHSKEELNAVAAKAKSGDAEAREELGRMVQPYVISYLRTIGRSSALEGRGYTADQRNEMTQEAWLGVWHALERFDPDRGVKFSSYAHHWVRHFVMEWVASNTRSLRLPRKSWHYALLLDEAWEQENPGRDIWEATEDELRSLELRVEREGEIVTLTLDGEGRRLDAADIVRALHQTSSHDPETDTRASQSAESDFFEEAVDLDAETLAAIGYIREALDEGDEEMALTIAEDLAELCSAHGLDIPVSHIMDVAEGPA